MTAFDYHYRWWRKSIIEEYLRQRAEGCFDPATFASWMETQTYVGGPFETGAIFAANGRRATQKSRRVIDNAPEPTTTDKDKMRNH